MCSRGHTHLGPRCAQCQSDANDELCQAYGYRMPAGPSVHGLELTDVDIIRAMARAERTLIDLERAEAQPYDRR